MAAMARRSTSGKAQLVFVLIVLSSSLSLAKTKKYHLEITYGFASPDCVERQVVLTNGQYPGPTLYAREGDVVKVTVHNHLPTGEGVAIHWHGFTQIGTPWMDGVGYVSQCPIEQGEVFTYEFLADKSGTYMYHGHYGMHITEGLYGLFIVGDKKKGFKPYKYDAEIQMIAADWWHRSTKEFAAGLLSNKPFRFPGEPQSILINGKGKYNCSLVPTVPAGGTPFDAATCNASSPDCSRTVFTVKPGMTYRLRIVNAATLSHLNLIVEGHNLTMIETDVYYTRPLPVSSLDVYNGQSYSVLFTADQKPGNYWIGLNVRSRKPNTPTGLAILNYEGVPVADPVTPTPVSPLWNDTAFSIAQAGSIRALNLEEESQKVPVPKESTIKIILLNQQTRDNGVVKWSINNVSWVEPETPFMQSSYFGLPLPPPPTLNPPVYDYSQPPPNTNTTIASSFFRIPLGAVVDFTLQNANMLAPNASDNHPWHIHGHHFWVVGSGPGVFNPAVDPKSYNLFDPPHRHTTPVFRYGWTTVRFIANNPGHWLFHCHIILHQFMGMGIAFGEGLHKLPPPPSDLQFCGALDYGFLKKRGFKP